MLIVLIRSFASQAQMMVACIKGSNHYLTSKLGEWSELKGMCVRLSNPFLSLRLGAVVEFIAQGMTVRNSMNCEKRTELSLNSGSAT